jgi:PadR family transcriptional regulator PadR
MAPRGYCRRHGQQFGPCSCSLGKLSRLVEPALLFLLGRQDTAYGYELLQQLPEVALTDSEIDVGAVYRVLHTLERADCVISHWEPGPGGPDRRVYRITPVGREHLQDWATVLERRGRQMLEFAARSRGLTD